MSRVFAVRVRELGAAIATAAEPGEFLVSDECVKAVLDQIGDDILIWGRENGKLVHPDD